MNTKKKRILILGDILAFIASFFAFVLLRYPTTWMEQAHAQWIGFTTLSLIWILILYILNLYSRSYSRLTMPTLRPLGIFIIIASATGTSLFYFTNLFGITPRTNLVIYLFLFLIFFTLWRRIIWSMYLYRNSERLFFLGNQEITQNIAKALQTQRHGYSVIGIGEKIPENIDTVVFEESLPQEVLAELTKKSISYITLQKMAEIAFDRTPLETITTKEFSRSLEQHNHTSFLKRIFEIIVATIILVITLPFTLLAAVGIYLEDKGPLFYFQKRVGKGGVLFTCIKFRSMKEDAEKDGPQWAKKNDLRTTHIGRFLRKTHIDEIPQMINVIRGDMALVGPRPERPEFVSLLEKEFPAYTLRHTVRPGFTGWAQIKFHYARTVDESKTKLEYDIYYIRNRNFFLDLGVLAKTVQILFTH